MSRCGQTLLHLCTYTPAVYVSFPLPEIMLFLYSSWSVDKHKVLQDHVIRNAEEQE
jgi:hypothetical protein